MPRLHHDRFLVLDSSRVCDLVTGAEGRADALPLEAPGLAAEAPAVVREVLAHGHDGVPRTLTLDVADARAARALTVRVGAAARAAGFIAIRVDLYQRVALMLRHELRDRSLVLISGPASDAQAARRAWLDAAAATPRAHVLLTVRLAVASAAPALAREPATAYAATVPPAADANPEVRRWVLQIERALTAAQRGRHAAAARDLREAAAALQRRAAAAPAAAAWRALGCLLLERGRAGQAESVFAQAALAAETLDDHTAPAARLWQAAARCDAGRLTESEALARAVLQTGPAPLRAWAAASVARAQIWQQRPVDHPVPAVETAASACLGPSTVAFVEAVGVRTLLAAGCLHEAGGRATAAMTGAEAASDPLAWLVAAGALLRVRAACGDGVGADDLFRRMVGTAQRLHLPLRAQRARLYCHDAWQTAGDARRLAREQAVLRRLLRVAPPLVRRAIEARLTTPTRAHVAVPGVLPQAAAPGRGGARLAAVLVQLAHEEDEDVPALRRVLDRLLAEVRPGRLELLACDAGPVTTTLSFGSGVATHVGPRVLDLGMHVGPEHVEGAVEIGVPVRLGSRLLAALVARWPPDRRPPDDAAEVMALAAAALAARLDLHQARARTHARAAADVPELVGGSGVMHDVRRAIVRAAAAPFTVLIEGESGVGKELAARAIHQLSARRERRFCDVNCAALPEELLDAELFGHAKGAYTGAIADRAGLFEDADGGTLFLDEVADLSARGQAKLLRVLQQQEVRRVGETRSRPVDVRLVAAANRDMRVDATEGRFRRDLLYRIDVIRLRIPPLRERPDDIAVLAEHFWRAAAARVGSRALLTHQVLSALTRYQWPGNIRELQNVMAALAVVAPARGRVPAALLPPAVTGVPVANTTRLAEAREQFERRCVDIALARAGGNRTRAAAQLGLTRQGLLKTMRRLRIEAQ